MFGTYLHGLFDSGELTEQLAAYLCRRRGIAPEQAAPLSMEPTASSSLTGSRTVCALRWIWMRYMPQWD